MKVEVALAGFRIFPAQSRCRAFLPAAAQDDDVPVQGGLALGQGDPRAAVFPGSYLQLVRRRAVFVNGQQGLQVQLELNPVSGSGVHRRGNKIGVGDPVSRIRPAHSLLLLDPAAGDISRRHQGGDGYPELPILVRYRSKVSDLDSHLFPGKNPAQGNLENIRAELLQKKSAVAFSQGLIVNLESFSLFPYFAGDGPVAHPGAELGNYRFVGHGEDIDNFQAFFPVIDVELLN